jgi:amidase
MGSVRIPAACCGLVGIKPAAGLIPYGQANDWQRMSQHGPLATTVGDLALALAVLADDASLARVPDLGGLRIAVDVANPLAGLPVARHWRQAAPAAAAALSSRGHHVTVGGPKYPLWLGPALVGRWAAGVDDDVQAGIEAPDALQHRTARHAAVGRVARRTGLSGVRWQDRWKHVVASFFADHDVLITPALAQDPVRSVAWSTKGWAANLLASARYAPYCAPWNYADRPAMTVPLPGRTPAGTPLGVQLVGRDVTTLLALASQLEQALPWDRHAPA